MSKALPAFLDQLHAQVRLYEKCFGQLVNRVRNEQGLSQEKFGEGVGLSRTEMHHLEGGETDMKLSTFLLMCRAMRRGFAEVAGFLEHQVEHPEDRVPETPPRSQRGKNTRRSPH